MKKILSVFGTRPEAIKMCPLVCELQKRKNIHSIVCITGQHADMMDAVLAAFSITPDIRLSLPRRLSLAALSSQMLRAIDDVLERTRPDIVLVHGDTNTAMITGLAAFYRGIAVGHVEAGLRTGCMTSPFPEEYNRTTLSLFARYHFAPSTAARDNLLREGRQHTDIFVVGNTAIDALGVTVKPNFSHPILDAVGTCRLVLLTAHRRENLGAPMRACFLGIKKALERLSDVVVVYPVHPNPAVQAIAQEVFADCKQVHLVPPLDVFTFHNLLARATLVLSDSGGVQEEAPALGVPVLVLRDTTERPEGVTAGTLRLIGTDSARVAEEVYTLLTDKAVYARMARAINPYGDGTAARQIADILEKA